MDLESSAIDNMVITIAMALYGHEILSGEIAIKTLNIPVAL